MYRVKTKAQAKSRRLFSFPIMSRTSSSRRRPSASRSKLVQKKPVPAANLPQTPQQRELNTKRRGELAELAFVLKAANLGFGVARPYGDSERYDVVLDARDLLPRRRRARPASVRQECAGRAVPPRTKGPCHSERSRSERDGAVEEPGASRADSKRSDAERNVNQTAQKTPRRQSPEIPTCPPDPSPPLWRVQVKCSTQISTGLYRVNAHRRANGRAVPYLPGEIHFFAVYIIPEDTWYIIPLCATRGVTSLLFRRRRDRRPGLYDAYREAWHLLRPK
jgi:hypothetical protein